MKMKRHQKKRKRNEVLFTLLKNGYLFERYFWTRDDFIGPLQKLREKWNAAPPKKGLAGFAWHIYSLAEIRKRNREAYTHRIRFIRSLTDGQTEEFHSDILDLLHRSDLGEEWVNTTADYIVSSWVCPPSFNLFIDEGRGEDVRRVTLVLNPDTSLRDIEAAWPTITGLQRELHPRYRKKHLTEKSFENLRILIEDLRTRYLPQKHKQHANEDSTQRITDADIVAKIWPDGDIRRKTDHRRRARLRQIRRRAKGP